MYYIYWKNKFFIRYITSCEKQICKVVDLEIEMEREIIHSHGFPSKQNVTEKKQGNRSFKLWPRNAEPSIKQKEF